MIVSLVGLPGAGKSTVGKQLARHLHWDFADADHEIEARLGHGIQAHFDQFGEASFRDVEQSVMLDLSGRDRLVLATGGGAVMRAENRAAMKSGGNLVVYLRAQLEDLARRLRNDSHRPMFKSGNHLAKLREVFAARDPLYRDVSDFVVDTGRHSVPTIAHLVAMQLELAAPHVWPGRSTS